MKLLRRILLSCFILFFSVSCLFGNVSLNVVADESMTVEDVFLDRIVSDDVHNRSRIHKAGESSYYTGCEDYVNYQETMPAITVLTHGLGGNASHWSNAGMKDVFAYNSHSLIARIQEKLQNRMLLYYADGKSATSFDLYRVNLNNYSQKEKLSALNDVSKHIVLVYESPNPNVVNGQEYRQFEYVIDTISLQYKRLTGYLPRLNLVGHSRGGITNIMYATEHIYNVDAIYSMGTPYNGSIFGEVEILLDVAGQTTVDTVENKKVPTIGATSIMDETSNILIRNAWNAAYNSTDKDINVTALGAVTSMNMVRAFIEDYIELDSIIEQSCAPALVEGFYNIIFNFVERYGDEIVYLTLTFINNFVEHVQEEYGYDIYDLLVSQYITTEEVPLAGEITVEEIQNVIGLIRRIKDPVTEEETDVILDDLFIDINSQHGRGFADNIDYAGFKTPMTVFYGSDIEYGRSIPDAPAVVHNIETMNIEFTARIRNGLRYGVGEDTHTIVLNGQYSGTFTEIQVFRYTPEFSGRRKVSCQNGKLAVYEYTETGVVLRTKVIPSTSWYEAGKSYLIVVEQDETQTGSMQFSMEIVDFVGVGTSYQELRQGEKWLKLNLSDDYFYRLSCNAENATFFVYDEDFQLIEEGTNGIRVSNGNYLVLSTNTNTSSVTLTCTKERDIVFEDPRNLLSVETITVSGDEEPTLPTLSKYGWNFIGWYDNPAYTGEAIVAADIAEMSGNTITLYAKWTGKTYSITYDMVGVCQPYYDTYTVGEGKLLDENVECEGYIFGGWYTDPYYFTQVVSVPTSRTGNLTYYARWYQVFTVTLTWDPRIVYGGEITLSLNDQTVTQMTWEIGYNSDFYLPIAKCYAYYFKGWYSENTQITDSNGRNVKGYTYAANMTLTPKFEHSYSITLVSTEHLLLHERHEWLPGVPFLLPSYTSEDGFRVKSWSGNLVGTEYTTPAEPMILYAEWEGLTYNIIYENITFGNQTARVIVDNRDSKLAPTTYQCGVGLSLTNITANISATGAYSPRLRFLGWYTTPGFSTSIGAIPTTVSGDFTIYAKWRYDYTTMVRTNGYIVDDTRFYAGYYDEISVATIVANYSELKAKGMQYLAIKIKMNITEVVNEGESTTDQNQLIYVYSESPNGLQTIKQLAHTTITNANTTGSVKEMILYVNIDDLVGLNSISICYAAESKEDVWVSGQTYAELMCVTDTWDATSAPDFYFSDDDPFV